MKMETVIKLGCWLTKTEEYSQRFKSYVSEFVAINSLIDGARNLARSRDEKVAFSLLSLASNRLDTIRSLYPKNHSFYSLIEFAESTYRVGEKEIEMILNWREN